MITIQVLRAALQSSAPKIKPLFYVWVASFKEQCPLLISNGDFCLSSVFELLLAVSFEITNVFPCKSQLDCGVFFLTFSSFAPIFKTL